MSHFLWSALDENWEKTEEYWYIIDKIIGPSGGGGGPDEWFGNYKKLTKDEKKKVIRLILHRNGVKFEQQKEVMVDKYKVTINDIKGLVEEHLQSKKKIQIKIEDISLDNEEWNS